MQFLKKNLHKCVTKLSWAVRFTRYLRYQMIEIMLQIHKNDTLAKAIFNNHYQILVAIIHGKWYIGRVHNFMFHM
jgi:hypothetical protein